MIRKQLNRCCAVIAALAGMLTASTVQGDSTTYSVFSRFTSNGSDNPAAQFSVEVRDFDHLNIPLVGQVSFLFRNVGSIASSITSVHFEDGALFGIDHLNNGPGVDFEHPGPGGLNVPGGSAVSFTTTAGFKIHADSGPPGVFSNGVNNTTDLSVEWLEVIFDLESGLSYDDVIAAIANGFKKTQGQSYSGDSLRIAIHVQGIGGDEESDSFILTIPLPAPFGLALAGFAGVVIISRRKRKVSAPSLD